MTPKQITLIQESLRKVPPEAAAELFYDRLFTLDPDLKRLFVGDIKEQGSKLMSMITIVVNGLMDLEPLLPTVRALGARHAGYGVKPEHYDTVGDALLWTLAQGLGDDFTDDVRQAWADAYGLLSSTMIQASLPKAA